MSILSVLINLSLLLAFVAGAGRYQAADDNILFKAFQVVNFAVNGGFNKHPGGFLERRGRKEAVGGQGSLGNSQEQAFNRGLFGIFLGITALVGSGHHRAFYCFTGQKIGRAGVMDKITGKHLLGDYLNVDRILWLKHGIVGDDTDGHIDNLARFVSPHKIVYCLEEDPQDENCESLQKNLSDLKTMSKGLNLEIIPLPMPGHVSNKKSGMGRGMISR